MCDDKQARTSELREMSQDERVKIKESRRLNFDIWDETQELRHISEDT